MKFTSQNLILKKPPVVVSDELLESMYKQWYLNILCNLDVGEYRDTDFQRITRVK